MLVLWVIIVLGLISVGVVSAARTQTSLAATLRSRVVSRYAAESGVEATKHRFEWMLKATRAPEEQARAFRRLEELVEREGQRSLGSARYQVTVLDLGSRVDLNNSGEELLRGLFEELFGERKTERLLAALRDWVDEDDEASSGGAEAADYARAGSPFRPTNGPLLRLDDIKRIRGFDEAVALALAPYVTVHGDGRVNVNTAPRADALVWARGQRALESKADVWRALAEALGGGVGAQLGPLTTLPSRILIVSRGWEEGWPLTHEIQAVYEVLPAGVDVGIRLKARYWSERDL
jgi:general secretion pathway protein K